MGQDPRAQTLTCAHQHSLGLPRRPCRPEQGRWHRCHPNHFPAAAGHWCGYSKNSERMLEGRDSSVHNLGGSHMAAGWEWRGKSEPARAESNLGNRPVQPLVERTDLLLRGCPARGPPACILTTEGALGPSSVSPVWFIPATPFSYPAWNGSLFCSMFHIATCLVSGIQSWSRYYYV